MMPDNVLSATPIVADFVFPDNKPYNPRIDYEHGGIALQDPTQGLRYAVWQAVCTPRGIMLSCPKTNYWDLVVEGSGITEVSLAFSQNMFLYLAYVQNEVAYLRWYNTVTETYETMTLGTANLGNPRISWVDSGNAVNPRICLDDKRMSQSLVADVILMYLKKRVLCMRLERDNFAIEYELGDVGSNRLHKIGMSKNYRLRIEMGFKENRMYNSEKHRIR